MLKLIPFYGTLIGRQLLDGIQATHSHVLVYGAIEAHSLGNRGCIASNATIGEETGLKITTVSTTISILAKAGWIKVYLDQNNHRQGIEPLMDIKPPLSGHKPPPLSTLNIDSSNKVTEKTNVFSTDLKGGLKTEETPQPPAPPYQQWFDGLVKILGYDKLLFTAERNKKLKARLKSFTIEQISIAAKNISMDEFMQGKNDSGKKYGTIDYLLRNDEKLEQWVLKGGEQKKEVIF